MRQLPAGITVILLVSALACSDSPQSPTGARAPREGTPQADVVPVVHPLDVTFLGNARACFGLGCSPREVASLDVNGVILSYNSAFDFDYTVTTQHGVGVVSGPSSSFGLLSVSTSATPVDVSTPFTLEVSEFSPSFAPQRFTGTITGTVGGPLAGGVVVDFDPASGPEFTGHTIDRVPFTYSYTNVSGLMSITAMGPMIVSGEINHPITGLIQTRAR